MVAHNMGGGPRPVNIPSPAVFSPAPVSARGETIDWRAALARLEDAYSPHTLRSYRADFMSFETWCTNNKLSSLPAAVETVAAYLDACAPGVAPSTLRRRVAGIRKLHRLTRYPDPTQDEDVQLALRRARRKKPARPNQALGLTAALRDQLIAACSTDLVGLRNRAMIAVGYDMLCRRSELVALRVEDLELRPSGGANLLVRRSKADQDGNGRVAALSRRTVAILQEWLTAADISRGPMFRPVYRQRVLVRFLHPMVVSRLLKNTAKRAGLDPESVKRLSGHSMRVGCAQDLNRNRFDLLTIMRAGGWRSMNVVARYVEKVDLRIWD
jgi:site-specific recombinase XerD